MKIIVEKDFTTIGPEGHTTDDNLLHTLLQCTAHHIEAYHTDLAHDYKILRGLGIGDAIVIFVNVNGTHSYRLKKPVQTMCVVHTCTLAEMVDIQQSIDVKAVWKVERTSEGDYLFTEMEYID